MIYPNKFYSIPDAAKKLKIKEKDIYILINAKIVSTSDMFGIQSLRGDIILTLFSEIKKFNTENKKDVIKISEGDLING